MKRQILYPRSAGLSLFLLSLESLEGCLWTSQVQA